MSIEENKAVAGRWFTPFWGACPDLPFGGTADLIAKGDHVVGQWIAGGTHSLDSFDDMPVGALQAG